MEWREAGILGLRLCKAGFGGMCHVVWEKRESFARVYRRLLGTGNEFRVNMVEAGMTEEKLQDFQKAIGEWEGDEDGWSSPFCRKIIGRN